MMVVPSLQQLQILAPSCQNRARAARLSQSLPYGPCRSPYQGPHLSRNLCRNLCRNLYRNLCVPQSQVSIL